MIGPIPAEAVWALLALALRSLHDSDPAAWALIVGVRDVTPRKPYWPLYRYDEAST
jgi:hypothetical protein